MMDNSISKISCKNFPFYWFVYNKNRIRTSYSYNVTNAKILDVYNNFVLTDFRTFSKGFGTFNQLNVSTLFLNYQLGNWSDKFFANTTILYNKYNDFFSTNSLITQNYTQSEKIIIKDKNKDISFKLKNKRFIDRKAINTLRNNEITTIIT